MSQLSEEVEARVLSVILGFDTSQDGDQGVVAEVIRGRPEATVSFLDIDDPEINLTSLACQDYSSLEARGLAALPGSDRSRIGAKVTKGKPEATASLLYNAGIAVKRS